MSPVQLSVFERDEDDIKYQLLEPLVYFEKHALSRFTNLLNNLFDVWLEVPQEKSRKQQQITNLFVSIILIWDDIADESTLRQGIPAAHLLFGIPQTVNAILYGCSLMLKNVISLGKIEEIDVYLKYFMKTVAGQAREFCWRNRGICPTEEEYLNGVVPKTSAAFLFYFKMMQAFSENKVNMTKELTLVGEAGQIMNDYVDLQCHEYNSARGYCNDITIGTFTFPLIHAIESHPEDDQVINILRGRTSDYEKKKHCVSLLQKYGSFDYTKKRVEEMVKTATEDFKRFPKNMYLEQILKTYLLQLDPSAPLGTIFDI